MGGNFCEAHVLNVSLRIHADHGLLADRALQAQKRSPGARVLLRECAARHPHRLIHRKVTPVILEHPQFGFLDLGVGGVQIDQVHRAIIDCLKGEAVLHAIDPLRRQMQLIGGHHPLKAVLPIHEFVAECGANAGFDLGQIADGVKVVLLGE